jgi:LDH2 family malate/lactate/ureidoglycolate dehydrogenase
MPIVKIDQIERVVQAALENHGATPWVAKHVARATARAEAFGNKICGLYYVESYCQQLRSGRVRGDVEPVVTRPRGAHVRVDAGFGFAQPAFARGLQTAVAATKELGTVSFAVSHAHTCTSLGYFTEQIAAQGLIGSVSQMPRRLLPHRAARRGSSAPIRLRFRCQRSGMSPDCISTFRPRLWPWARSRWRVRPVRPFRLVGRWTRQEHRQPTPRRP